MQDFPVTVFASGSGSPRVGSGSLATGILRVALHEGATLEWRLDQVDVRLGGASGKMLFLVSRVDGTTVTVDVQGFPAALAIAAGGALDGPLAQFRSTVRARRWVGRALLGATVALALAFGAFLVALPRRVARTASSLPKSVDVAIGDAVYDSLAPADQQVHDPSIDAAVTAILDRLSPYARREGFDLVVRVVRSRDVNAFALPGGRIVLNAGLLEAAERPEVVAGVLAHEIAHVTRRHGLEKLAASLGIKYGISLVFGQIDFLPAYAADGAMLAALSHFSRAEETEADTVGVTILADAGVDPSGLAEVFRELAATPGAEVPGMVAWLSSHPDHASRIANVERLARAVPPASLRPIAVADWPSVRAAARTALSE